MCSDADARLPAKLAPSFLKLIPAKPQPPAARPGLLGSASYPTLPPRPMPLVIRPLDLEAKLEAAAPSAAAAARPSGDEHGRPSSFSAEQRMEVAHRMLREKQAGTPAAEEGTSASTPLQPSPPTAAAATSAVRNVAGAAAPSTSAAGSAEGALPASGGSCKPGGGGDDEGGSGSAGGGGSKDGASASKPKMGRRSLLGKLRQAGGQVMKASRQMQMASSMVNTLGQRVRERRAAYREILSKPGAERTPEDLAFLMDWANQIKFRDEQVQKAVNREMLCKVMTLQPCEPDDVIIRQGEEGDAFYVVFSGGATVYVAYDVKNPPPGPSGQASAWPDEMVESVQRRMRIFRRHERGEPLDSPKRPGTALAGVDELDDPDMSEEQRGAIRRALEYEARIQAEADAEAEAEAKPEKKLGSSFRRRASGIDGDIIASFKKEEPPEEVDPAKGLKRLFTIAEYDCFGDLALLFNAPRSAAVFAEKDTLLVRVDREDYNAVVKTAALEAVRARAVFLSGLPAFSKYHLKNLVNVASYLKQEQLSSGENIVAEGAINDDIIIVERGNVEVQRRTARGMPPSRMLTLGQGSFVGALDMPASTQRALLPSLISSKAGVEGATVLRLRRVEFEFRAGRSTVALMGLQEATAWLSRLAAPGPLRALFTAPLAAAAGAPAAAAPTDASGSPMGQRPSISVGAGVASPVRGGGGARTSLGAGGINELEAITAWLTAQKSRMQVLLGIRVGRGASKPAMAEDDYVSPFERKRLAEQAAKAEGAGGRPGKRESASPPLGQRPQTGGPGRSRPGRPGSPPKMKRASSGYMRPTSSRGGGTPKPTEPTEPALTREEFEEALAALKAQPLRCVRRRPLADSPTEASLTATM